MLVSRKLSCLILLHLVFVLLRATPLLNAGVAAHVLHVSVTSEPKTSCISLAMAELSDSGLLQQQTVGNILNLDATAANRIDNSELAKPIQGKDQIGSHVTVGNHRITKEVRLNVLPNVPKDVYKFSDEEVTDVEAEWSATLIGVLIGSPVTPSVLSEFMQNNGQVEMPKFFFKDNRMMVFKFNTKEECLWVLENGPWLIGGNKSLILKEWRTDMSIDWSSF